MIPNMGTTEEQTSPTPSGVGDALFSKTQQRVLTFLFGQPQRSYFSKELIQLTGGGSGAIQRELKKLADCGLIAVTRSGSQKYYQANPASPIFDELCEITRKTFGLLQPLRDALKPIADTVYVAFLYGSVASGSDHAQSDVDLMIISDTTEYADVFALVEPLSQSLQRTVNPTIMTRRSFLEKLDSENPFITKVMKRDRIFVIGEDHDLTT